MKNVSTIGMHLMRMGRPDLEENGLGNRIHPNVQNVSTIGMRLIRMGRPDLEEIGLGNRIHPNVQLTQL